MTMDRPTTPGDYWYTDANGPILAYVYTNAQGVLESRTRRAYGNGPVDGLPGTWEPLVDPEVLAAAERRIVALEAEVAKWKAEYQWRYDRIVQQGERIVELEAEVARLTTITEQCEQMSQVRLMEEEAWLEEQLWTIRGTLETRLNERPMWGNLGVMTLFDAVVAQLTGKGH